MRAVIQRVETATVDVGTHRVAAIRKGLLIFLGVAKGDGEEQARELASKTVNMRIFEDESGKMNLNVSEAGGQVLTVPQFTLAADVSKGRRPSFDTAAPPDEARRLFKLYADTIAAGGILVARGAFGEHMHVTLINDGPVTFVVDC